jgi:hypothetical protein
MLPIDTLITAGLPKSVNLNSTINIIMKPTSRISVFEKGLYIFKSMKFFKTNLKISSWVITARISSFLIKPFYLTSEINPYCFINIFGRQT